MVKSVMSQCRDRFVDATINIGKIYHIIDPEVVDPMIDEGPQLETDNPSEVQTFSVNQVVFEGKYRVIDFISNTPAGSIYSCRKIDDPTDISHFLVSNGSNHSSDIIQHEYDLICLLQQYSDETGFENVNCQKATILEHNGIKCLMFSIAGPPCYECTNSISNFSEFQIALQNIAKGILNGLSFLHRHNIVHANLHPAAVVFSDDSLSSIKIVDFQHAFMQNESSLAFSQSRFYRSPELLLGNEISQDSDIWAAGVILAEIYLGIPLFACDSECDILHCIVALLGEIPQELIVNSPNWWKFYDANPRSFTIKFDPYEILLQRHPYHNKFTKGITLSNLIIQHRNGNNECFAHFISGLLRFTDRWTADQALQHPFITGKPYNSNWSPPRLVRKSSHLSLPPKIISKPIIHATHHPPAPSAPTLSRREEDDFLSMF